MQGHLPGPPQPHVPISLAPFIGYMATREPQPLEERTPEEPEWWEDDVYAESWGRRHPPLVRVVAAVLSVCLVVAGVGTVLELVLTAR